LRRATISLHAQTRLWDLKPCFANGVSVAAGLVPVIHASLNVKDVDARHKAGHDG